MIEDAYVHTSAGRVAPPADVVACGADPSKAYCPGCVDAYRNGIEPGESACDEVSRAEYTGPIEVSPEPDAKTGVRRVSLWRGLDGGSFGNACGYTLTATYVSADGAYCAEVDISPVEYEPSNADVDEHALMQGATREEVAELPADALIDRYGPPPGMFGVDQRTTIGRAVREDGEHLRPDDSADIDYEGGSMLAFDTLERAQREADRLGREDLSPYFNFRPTEADACAAPCPHCGGNTAETCNCMEES